MEQQTDVWALETPDEEAAIMVLNLVVRQAVKGNKNWQNYLRELWPGESWQSIKAKLETEGSAWYVWWTDGVREHLRRLVDRQHNLMVK